MPYFSSNFDETKPFSDKGIMVELAADVELTWTVPGLSTTMWRAEFSFGGGDDYVWVALNKTAVAPTPGAVVEVNQQELRPLPKYVKGGDVLHFISSQDDIQFGISLLQLPNPA